MLACLPFAGLRAVCLCCTRAVCVCVGPLRTKGACAHFHEVMTYQAVLPVQQVGAMWTVLAADEVHLFPTSVDEAAIHEEHELEV